MFSNLENAIVIAAAIWGAVKLIQHFAPDFYVSTEAKFWTRIESNVKELEARIAALEPKKGAKK